MGWSADIADNDALRCKLWNADYKYERYLEIVNAVNERATAAGVATLTVPVRLDLWPMVRKNIHEKISSFFTDNNTDIENQYRGAFVNHLYSSGEWNGVVPFIIGRYSHFFRCIPIKKWIESDILTAIGATERIPWQISTDIPAWINQQYKILNKLRWTCDIFGIMPHRFFRKVGTGGSWAIAEASFNAATWVEQPTNVPFGPQPQILTELVSFNISGTYYTINRYYSIIQIPTIIGIEKVVDVYGEFEASGTNVWPKVYENNDVIGTTNNKISRIYQDVASGNTNMIKIDASTSSEPLNNSFIGWKITQTTARTLDYNTSPFFYCVSKFNVPGGFEYGDW